MALMADLSSDLINCYEFTKVRLFRLHSPGSDARRCSGPEQGELWKPLGDLISL